MQFLQILQAPVVRAIGPIGDKPARQLSIPRFTIDEFISWGAEIEQENLDQRTADMDENAKRQYLALYPPTAPDINELRRLVITPPGARRIVHTSLAQAKVTEYKDNGQKGLDLAPLTEDEVALIIKALGTYGTVLLARELADLDDRSMTTPKPTSTEKNSTSGKTDGADPLSKSGKQDSKSSPATGPKT